MAFVQCCGRREYVVDDEPDLKQLRNLIDTEPSLFFLNAQCNKPGGKELHPWQSKHRACYPSQIPSPEIGSRLTGIGARCLRGTNEHGNSCQYFAMLGLESCELFGLVEAFGPDGNLLADKLSVALPQLFQSALFKLTVKESPQAQVSTINLAGLSFKLGGTTAAVSSGKPKEERRASQTRKSSILSQEGREESEGRKESPKLPDEAFSKSLPNQSASGDPNNPPTAVEGALSPFSPDATRTSTRAHKNRQQQDKKGDGQKKFLPTDVDGASDDGEGPQIIDEKEKEREERRRLLRKAFAITFQQCRKFFCSGENTLFCGDSGAMVSAVALSIPPKPDNAHPSSPPEPPDAMVAASLGTLPLVLLGYPEDPVAPPPVQKQKTQRQKPFAVSIGGNHSNLNPEERRRVRKTLNAQKKPTNIFSRIDTFFTTKSGKLGGDGREVDEDEGEEGKEWEAGNATEKGGEQELYANIAGAVEGPQTLADTLVVRCLGMACLKSAGISTQPDIHDISISSTETAEKPPSPVLEERDQEGPSTRSKAPSFLVLASPGVLQGVGHGKAVEIVLSCLESGNSAQKACDALLEGARRVQSVAAAHDAAKAEVRLASRDAFRALTCKNHATDLCALVVRLPGSSAFPEVIDTINQSTGALGVFQRGPLSESQPSPSTMSPAKPHSNKVPPLSLPFESTNGGLPSGLYTQPTGAVSSLTHAQGDTMLLNDSIISEESPGRKWGASLDGPPGPSQNGGGVAAGSVGVVGSEGGGAAAGHAGSGSPGVAFELAPGMMGVGVAGGITAGATRERSGGTSGMGGAGIAGVGGIGHAGVTSGSLAANAGVMTATGNGGGPTWMTSAPPAGQGGAPVFGSSAGAGVREGDESIRGMTSGVPVSPVAGDTRGETVGEAVAVSGVVAQSPAPHLSVSGMMGPSRSMARTSVSQGGRSTPPRMPLPVSVIPLSLGSRRGSSGGGDLPPTFRPDPSQTDSARGAPPAVASARGAPLMAIPRGASSGSLQHSADCLGNLSSSSVGRPKKPEDSQAFRGSASNISGIADNTAGQNPRVTVTVSPPRFLRSQTYVLMRPLSPLHFPVTRSPRPTPLVSLAPRASSAGAPHPNLKSPLMLTAPPVIKRISPLPPVTLVPLPTPTLTTKKPALSNPPMVRRGLSSASAQMKTKRPASMRPFRASTAVGLALSTPLQTHFDLSPRMRSPPPIRQPSRPLTPPPIPIAPIGPPLLTAAHTGTPPVVVLPGVPVPLSPLSHSPIPIAASVPVAAPPSLFSSARNSPMPILPGGIPMSPLPSAPPSPLSPTAPSPTRVAPLPAPPSSPFVIFSAPPPLSFSPLNSNTGSPPPATTRFLPLMQPPPTTSISPPGLQMIRTRSPSPLQAPRPLGSRPVPPIAVPPLRTHSPLSGMSPLSAISQQRDRDAASASASAGSKKRLGQGRSAATSPLLPPSRHPNPPMRTLALFPGPPTSAAYSTSLQTHSATRTPVLLSPAVLSPRDYPGHPFSRVPLPHATKPSNAAPFQPVLRPPLPVPSASHFSPPSRADAAHFAGAPSRFTFAPGAPTPNVAHPPHATTPPAKPSDARPGTGPSMRPQPALFTFPKAAGLPPPTGQPYGFGSSHFIHSRPTYVPPLQRAPNTGLPPPGPSTRPPAWAPTASVGSREAGQGGGFWCGSGGDCAGRRGSQ